MQVPALHSESALHSVVGAQYGPECAVEGVEPGGHDSGSGSTTSASAMLGTSERTMQAARVRMPGSIRLPDHIAKTLSSAMFTRLNAPPEPPRPPV